MHKLIAAMVLASTSTAVFADDSGMYIYGAIGQARSRVDQVTLDSQLRAAGVTGLVSSTKNNPTAYKLQLGYQFNRNWAVEGGYLGTTSNTYTATGTNPITASASAKAQIWNISVAGTLPFGSGFSGTGRLGYASTHLTGSAVSSSPAGTFGSTLGATKSSATYGVGLKYDFTENASLRADLDNYMAGSRFDVWTIGVGYKF